MSATIFTKPVTMRKDGIKYALGTYESLAAIAAEMHERESYRFLLGCRACAAACSLAVLCGCCAKHRRDRHVTTGVHIPILTREAFLARLAEIERSVRA